MELLVDNACRAVEQVWVDPKQRTQKIWDDPEHIKWLYRNGFDRELSVSNGDTYCDLVKHVHNQLKDEFFDSFIRKQYPDKDEDAKEHLDSEDPEYCDASSEPNPHDYEPANTKYSWYIKDQQYMLEEKSDGELIVPCTDVINDQAIWAHFNQTTLKDRLEDLANKYSLRDSDVPEGYWEILTPLQKVGPFEMREITAIYQLLAHYCQRNRQDDDTPLSRSLHQVQMTISVPMKIGETEFKLTWWNKQKDAMAIEIKWVDQNLYFLRFHLEAAVKWEWYDNDKDRSHYTEYAGPNVKPELEASYLANKKNNFDPEIFAGKFNNAFLLMLQNHLKKIPGLGNRDYLFSCTFSSFNPEDASMSNVILGMDQITYNRNKSSKFSRSLRRFRRRNDKIEEEENKLTFAQVWKLAYKLDTGKLHYLK